MTASDDLSKGANSLLPKLQTKLVVLPGAINTQELHGHYTSHNATANRLLQRLAILEQLTARYAKGVLQPEAMRSRYQRFQRTEALGGSELPFNMPVLQRLPDSEWQQNQESSNFFSQGEPTVSMPPQPSYTTPIATTSSGTQVARLAADRPPINHNSLSATPSGTYRISRRSTIFDSSSGNIPAPGDADSGSSARSASTPITSLPLASPNARADPTTTVTENPNFTANPSQPSGSTIQAKMQPQTDNHSEVDDVITTTHTPATMQQKYGQPEGFQSASDSTSGLLYRVARKTVENLPPPAPSPATRTEGLDVKPNSTAISLPAPTSATQASDLAIQRKYHQSELLWHSGHAGAKGVLNNPSVVIPANNSAVRVMENPLTHQTDPTGVALQRKYHQSELLWNSGSDGEISGSKTPIATATPANNAAVAGTGNPLTHQTGVALQRKYHQSELLLRPGQNATGVLARAADSKASDRTKNHRENADGIVRVASSEVTVPAPALVQTKPLPLLVQRQVTEELTRNRGDSLIQNRSDLPLAISSIHSSALVSRQTTTAPVEAVTSETINAIPTPTAPATSLATNSGVDLAEIAEQVSRIILRRLVVERERRGMGI